MTLRAAARDLLNRLVADEADGYVRVDADNARLMGALLWSAGVVVTVALLPFAPPTAAIGAPGWFVAACVLAGCAIVVRRRLDERLRLNFSEVFVSGSFGLVAIAVLQWLAGPPGAPYHYLYVLPVVYVAAVHRRRRVLWFLVGTVLAVCAPLAYDPHDVTSYDIVAQVALLLALGGVARILFVTLRSQRHALRKAKRRADRLARQDALTGLGNRRAFDESLGLEVARAKRAGVAVSLVVADIDGFKQINDRYGHPRGDDYLRNLAAVLSDTARAGDVCFRWGGDEFALLLPATDRGEAEAVCARIAAAIAANDSLAVGADQIELTFGIAQLGEGESGTDLVVAADAMLLSRKRRKPVDPVPPADSEVSAAAAAAPGPAAKPEPPPLALETPRRRRVDQRLFVAVGFVVGSAFAYLAALLIAGADLGPALPLVIVTAAAAAAALTAWQRDREAATAAADAQQRDALRNLRLARKIVRLHDVEPQSEGGDVGSMVVRVAVNLLDAEKGVLLTRTEGGGDRLQVSGAVGFGDDPSDLQVVRRFAERALARDATVRQNTPPAPGPESGLRNLVAIPLYAQEIHCGVVICANRPGGFTDLEDGVLLSLGDHAASALQNGRLRAEARRSYVATVRMLLDAIRVKDPSLGGHSVEVSSYVARVADALGLDAARRERLVFGSMLHDIGKLGISEQILLKPEPLTGDERHLVQTHPLIGARLVMQVDALVDLADGILHHHERIDGLGYPHGLAGDEISLDARVIAVADSFSAMTAKRPYGERLSPEQACAELERNAGSQFDARVVEIFVDQVRRAPEEPHSHALEIALSDPELAELPTEKTGVLGDGSSAGG